MAQNSSLPSVLPGLPGYNPNNLQPWFVQVVTSMTVLAGIAVVLRIASRRSRQQELWWDDRMIIVSVLWYFVLVGFCWSMYAVGMGIHADKVEPKNIVTMAKWLLVCEILYVWNLGITKLGVLLMYYRIFRIPIFKKMAWAVGALVIAWVICITFVFIFICLPVQKLWDPTLPGHCINQVDTWIANASATIFTDLVILFMPMPKIWTLQLRTTEKVALTLAFSLGFFVVFTSAYRTSVLFTYSRQDPTYTLAPVVGWTAIELSAGIVSACLPTLLPIFQIFARFIGIKRNLLSPRSNVKSGENTSGGKISSRTGGASQRTSTGLCAAETHRSSGSAFYRLEDETESDGSFNADSKQAAIDTKLRPDTRDYKHTVKSFRTQEPMVDGTRDNIPLHGIRVQRDIEQSITPRECE